MSAKISIVAASMFFITFGQAKAGEPMTLQLDWRAQAENGGYYEAVEKGYYKDCGVDLTIRQGGPGIDTTQLLTGGAVDVALVSQNDGVMRMNEAGFPARAVMAAFQRSPQTLDVHSDSGITKLKDMVGHPILISGGNRNTLWPFLKGNFGFQDSQLRSFTGQFAPFLADKRAVTQDFITYGPFVMKRDAAATVKSFLLADHGYTPYGSLVVVSQNLIDQKPKAVKCLVEASKKGWTDYLVDPSSAITKIIAVAPENSKNLMSYSVEMMAKYNIVQTSETSKIGIGGMTDARWREHFDLLVRQGLFKSSFDYKKSYTLQFLN